MGLFVIMDPVVISALIAAIAAVAVNIISNVILSTKQTAVLEEKIRQLTESLNELKGLPDRVTRLETNMAAVQDSLKEMRLS